MARWAPGVVTIQCNSGTGQSFVYLPKIVQADIEPSAPGLILFYKRPGDSDWSLRQITDHEKKRIQIARKEGRVLKVLQSILR